MDETTIPLWAFLASTIIGPVVGAGLTVLGTWLTNRHASAEAEKAREFQQRADFIKWRNEFRNKLYMDINELIYRMAMDLDKSPQHRQDLYNKLNSMVPAVNLHGSDTLLFPLMDALESYQYLLNFIGREKIEAEEAYEVWNNSIQNALVATRVELALLGEGRTLPDYPLT